MTSKKVKAFLACASISFLTGITIFGLAKSNVCAGEVSKAECDALHDEIENDFIKANFCTTDSDCKVVRLEGWYIDFGCYKFVNAATREDGRAIKQKV